MDRLENIYGKTFLWPRWQRQVIEFFRILFLLYPQCLFLLIKKMSISALNGKPMFNERKQNRYVSFMMTTEGLGGLLSRYTTCLILSDKFNLIYAHRPLCPMLMSEKQDFNTFLGYEDGRNLFTELAKQENLNVVYLPEFDMRFVKRMHIFLLKVIINHVFDDNNILFMLYRYSYIPPHKLQGYQTKIYGRLRSRYFDARQKFPVKNYFKDKKIKVAVHLRRGEITNFKNRNMTLGTIRWIENHWFIRTIEIINFKFGINALDIHLFSDEYDLEKLKDFNNIENVTIHLKKDSINQPFEAFHAMVLSDIGICSLSGFSYESGMLSNGLKILPKSNILLDDFREDPRWIITDNQGNFNPELLNMSLN